MALKFSTDDLTDKAGEATANILTNGLTSITLRPEYRQDKYNVSAASVQARTEDKNQRFDSLFFIEDAKGDSVRIQGASKYGAGEHSIEDADKIAKLATNFGFDPAIVASISYSTSANRINDVSVTFKEGADPEKLEPSKAGFILALEKQGLLPAGSTFEAGEKGVVTPSRVQMNVNSTDTRLQSFDFGADTNATGQAFSIYPRADGRAEFRFGVPATIDGHPGKLVTTADMAAANLIAAKLGLQVDGEVGRTLWGANIQSSKSVAETIGALSEAKLVNAVFTASEMEKCLAGLQTGSGRPVPAREPAFLAANS